MQMSSSELSSSFQDGILKFYRQQCRRRRRRYAQSTRERERMRMSELAKRERVAELALTVGPTYWTTNSDFRPHTRRERPLTRGRPRLATLAPELWARLVRFGVSAGEAGDSTGW